jgi:4,5-DOPA dioxygenase extradiol
LKNVLDMEHYSARLGPDARLAIPTPEHFLPFLFVLGTQQSGDKLSFPVSGFDGGSISMPCVQVG